MSDPAAKFMLTLFKAFSSSVEVKGRFRAFELITGIETVLFSIVLKKLEAVLFLTSL